MKKHPNIPASAWSFLVQLTKYPNVSSIILFGSRAFGDHEERSDVDVAICGEKITRTEWASIRDAAYHARSLYWITVVHFDTNPKKLRKRITETGTEIYVRTKIA